MMNVDGKLPILNNSGIFSKKPTNVKGPVGVGTIDDKIQDTVMNGV